eukprot:687912-Pyramimonas_sp.AAC.1
MDVRNIPGDELAQAVGEGSGGPVVELCHRLRDVRVCQQDVACGGHRHIPVAGHLCSPARTRFVSLRNNALHRDRSQ